MNKPVLLLSVLLSLSIDCLAQKAAIREEMLEMKTYPFSDPNPVPEMGRIYPYFDYSGYTANPEQMNWKMVILENDYIKVYVCPDIGGKVWGAIEKSTGEEFLYFNNVVKFRDVAMRGPWTSGGLEFNFGDIGHIPTCSTPVDYVIKENADGSVSCVVGAIDLPSETRWNVEIMVHPDRAYFEAKVRWFNSTSLPCTYYHWMNAAAKSAGNLEFIYPGTNYIGHGGDAGDWPVENGREINFYEENDFGSYKSYHVINAYTDFFGGYYHDDDFGFGHLSNYDEKPGKKLWIWGLSEQGMIWEDLLTDEDGQYIEFQAGKLFNQAAEGSTYTPFKHKEFAPHDSDIMTEIYFPFKETGGMVAACPEGVLNLQKKGDKMSIVFSALQPVEDILLVKSGDELVFKTDISLGPLEKIESSFFADDRDFTVSLQNGSLNYSSRPADRELERPLEPFGDFDWESAYGLYTKAYELEKQRKYKDALGYYIMANEKDPGFLPSITRIGLDSYRRMDYSSALKNAKDALKIDTYDPEANYLYGLINVQLRKPDEAKSGFSIAAASVRYRSASYTELARIFAGEKNYAKAIEYADKALAFNEYNYAARQIKALVLRKMGKTKEAEPELEKLSGMDPTNHFVRSERMFANKTIDAEREFTGSITNELPYESYLDLAGFYTGLYCIEEAIRILELSPPYPVKDIWLANLDRENEKEHVEAVISSSPEMVFPFRNETARLIENLIEKYDDWKLRYYLGLIYWNRGRDARARELFSLCGKDPDFAPFYVAMAQLCVESDDKRELLELAYEIEDNDWRAGLALAKHYLGDGNAGKALEILKPLSERYPEQSAIGLAFAQTLMAMKRFEQSVEFLESYTVLPFEGATIGRDLYHQACIIMVFNSWDEKDYENVASYGKKALQWPANLGVGKPYDVDERLENYFLSLAYDNLDQKEKSRDYLKRAADHPNDSFNFEGPRLIFQLLALDRYNPGDMDASEPVFKKVKEKYPDNPFLEWARLVLVSGGDYSLAMEKADEILEDMEKSGKRYSGSDIMEFKLISGLFSNH